MGKAVTLGDFTYEAYTDLMELLKKKCKILPFCEVASAKPPFLILRHDIDASLEAALRMAEIEKKLKMRSTYFVLFSHKLYNLLEKDSLAVLKKISALGHEVGLHYDIKTYEAYGQPLKKTLTNEIALLERLVNKKVFSISCHNPATLHSEDPFRKVKGFINAYDPRFRGELYVSDSCRTWQINYLNQLLHSKFKTAQLLIHPFLWTEDVCERETVLDRLFENVETRNREYKLSWLKLWQESLSKRLHEN